MKFIGYIKEEFRSDILSLNDIFQKNSFELYIVGGATRNYFMNTPVNDIDLVTNATPEDIQNILSTEGIDTLEVGVQFGVVFAILSGKTYEIATFRADGTGRKPEVTFANIGLFEDSTRRDFTINAIYYNIQSDEFIDPHSGIYAIQNNDPILDTIGTASDRFKEDPLRMIRALRFTCQFNMILSEEIGVGFLTQSALMNTISKERIYSELIKTKSFNALQLFRFWSYLFQYDIINYILKDKTDIDTASGNFPDNDYKNIFFYIANMFTCYINKNQLKEIFYNKWPSSTIELIHAILALKFGQVDALYKIFPNSHLENKLFHNESFMRKISLMNNLKDEISFSYIKKHHPNTSDTQAGIMMKSEIKKIYAEILQYMK